ncbi:MAG: Gfo/Idh/MocA family oxidoreductase [Acidobacteria bacterium]|nr:Gfo/Idh/MocA family oxidoreductase [Acidobacteriota bacterium]
MQASRRSEGRAVKVAVVGLGHLGSVHARLWREIPGVHLAALVDVDPDRAAARGREFGVPAFTDWRALPPDVEAVSLAVPTPLHGPLGVGILESGRDLLVEKPISATPEQADAMIAAAGRRARVLMVGHTERFNPAFVAARREVREPRFLEAQRMAPFVPRSLDVDVVLDLMIHDLDLALLLGGPEVEEVRAIGVNAFTDKIDIANARLRFASGCVANLTASRISRERVRKLRIFQPHRYLSVDLSARSLVACWLDPPGEDALPAIREEAVEVPPGEPLRLQLQAFAEAVRRRESAGCTGQEGRRALLLAHRILEEIAH